jgi:HEAT repeat protein
MNWNNVRRSARPFALFGTLVGLLVLILPMGLLALGHRLQVVGQPELLLWGVGFEALLGLLIFRRFGASWVVYSKTTIFLYLAGFAWFFAAKPIAGQWLTHLTVGVFALVPLLLLALQELLASGSAAVRKARFLVHQIASRTKWPTELDEARKLPEALALRETLLDDPTPAIALLGHPRAEVQVCALSALQYRPKWKRLHAQILLQTAQHSTQPVVRSSALTALANVDDPVLINSIVPYLRDPMMEVRRAAAGALLWKPEKRWAAIRHGLRANLNDAKCARDGALPCLTTLPLQALNDLTVWSGEIGSVGQRSTMTLISYYRRVVREEGNPNFFSYLAQQLVLPGIPSAVRVEIGHLLREQNMIDVEVAESLLRETEPGPLRIIGADVLLSNRSAPDAIEVLKEIARQPNRELALAAAVVIQKSLRIDLGLPLGESPPAPQSKQAAEIVRKVMTWAAQHDQQPKKDEESIDFDLPKGR